VDVDGKGLQGGDVHDLRSFAAAKGTCLVSPNSRSMQIRKAARVLPEPVGAAINVFRPAAISAHPPT
jgi:hypothetical protein